MQPLINTYLNEFNTIARQAYSRWNREPASPSFGSFDRAYWGWKYKDFSDATLQYAAKLAIEYSLKAGLTTGLPQLLKGYVAYCRKIQLADGSFNQCYPNEKTPGVIYDILSTLIYVRQCPLLTSTEAQSDLDGIIERAITFALRVDEKHGEIANHIAEFAYELLHYAHYAHDDRARRKGEEYLERLLSLFDETEGWFQEYQGPDPGYQTRTLRYLTKCALLLEQTELWDVIGKAADFIDTVLMPDGSIHPMLGTRSTALLYPSAFEILAARDDSYQALAARVRAGWECGRVPLPSWLDFDNAIRLADDAKDAADAYAANASCQKQYGRMLGKDKVNIATLTTVELPSCIDYPNAGLLVRRHKDYALYLGYHLGGVVIIYGLQNGEWQLLYEDSGYLVRSMDLKTIWLSRMPDSGCLIESSPDRLLVQADFFESLHDEVTPIRLVLLRVLNMTILRFQWIGDLFRKVVVRYLMSGRKKIPLTLQREIVIGVDKIHISDCINGTDGKLASTHWGQLFRCRRLIGIHMASSRYFQNQELEPIPLDWMHEIEWQANGATRHQIKVKIYQNGGFK